ncbi:hypothetical protein C8R30_1811, partial [Nitrosomonas nitrosa]
MTNSKSQSARPNSWRKIAGMVAILFAMFNTTAHTGGIPVID